MPCWLDTPNPIAAAVADGFLRPFSLDFSGMRYALQILDSAATRMDGHKALSLSRLGNLRQIHVANLGGEGRELLNYRWMRPRAGRIEARAQG